MAFKINIGGRDGGVKSLSREDVATAIAERSEFMVTVLREAGPSYDASKVTSVELDDGVNLAQFANGVNDELTELGKHRDELGKYDAVLAQSEREQRWSEQAARDGSPWRATDESDDDADGSKTRNLGAPKSLGSIYTDAAEFKAWHEAGKPKRGFEINTPLDAKAALRGLGSKTVFETTAGWDSQDLRIPRVALDEQRPIAVIDAIPLFETSQAAVVYMEETTFTNAAAERAENAAYAESAFALTQRTSTVRVIGASLPVTDEQLSDVPGVRDYLDSRLMFQVAQRIDLQITAGAGTGVTWEGTVNVTGINTQAKGADSVPDAIYKAMTLIRSTGFAEPSVVLLHPNDWQTIRLSTTADGAYLWGPPSMRGPEAIWGVPVIQSTAVTENTGVVGDYTRHAGLYVRQEAVIETGYVNDDFLDGRRTIRVGMRGALVHFRPLAFSTVTGI